MADDAPKPRTPLDAFLEAFWTDVEQDAIRPLADYRARFPGDDASIAAEYRTFKERGSSASPSSASPADQGPDRLGPYRIIRQIGRGAQGTVYLAEEVALRRNVALKVLDPGLTAHPEAIARFRREAAITSKLDDPGICPVYATGEDRSSFWIAMRYVEGDSLAKSILSAKENQGGGDFVVDDEQLLGRADPPTKDGTDPPGRKTWVEIARILAFFEQAARTLHVAHEAGVIHRDIKPGNLIVTKDGHPVILDFGLAQDIEGDHSTLTVTGDLAGTPAYMSPEQLMAQRIRLDRRTDVYSLGASLFECLTLKRPFDAPTRDGLYQAIMSKNPPNARELNPAVPGDLKVVLECALEKDRDRRYQTALDFAEDLGRVRTFEPILAKAVGPIGRFVRFARRRPAMAALITVLVFAIPIIAGLGGFLAANWDEIEQQKQRAIDEEVERHLRIGYFELTNGTFNRAISAFDRGLALKPESVEAVAGKAMALLRLGRATEALIVLDRPATSIEADNAFPWLRAAALSRLGRKGEADDLRRELRAPTTPLGLFLAAERDIHRGDASFNKDIDAYRSAVDKLAEAVVRAPVARLLYHSALLNAAAGCNDARVVRQVVPALSSLWPTSSESWFWVGYGLAILDDLDGADIGYRRAIELNPKSPVAHNNLALVLKRKGKIDEAIAELRRAIELDPKDSIAHNNLGIELRGKGQIDDAITEYRRAIELDPKDPHPHLGMGIALENKGQIDDAIAEYRRAIELHPKYASAHNNLGAALRDNGQFDEAIAEHRHAIDIDPKQVSAHNNLGVALQDKGLVDEAIAAYRRAIDIDPEYDLAHHNLARTLHGNGQIDEAIAAYRRAIELNPKYTVAHDNLGVALRGKGQIDDAIVEFRRAIELDPKYAFAYNNLGLALKHKGQVDDAIAEYRRAIVIDPKSSVAHNNLGAALKHKGQVDEAIAEFRRAISLDPNNALAHHNLGLELKNRAQIDEAIAEYRRAIVIEPQHATFHRGLGNALRAKGRIDDAIAEFRHAIVIDRKDALAHYDLGNALQDKGLVDEAIAEFRRAIELDPKYAFAHVSLAYVLKDKGRIDDAITEYRRGIELDPKCIEAHNNLGAALRDNGQFDEAIAEFRRAIELDPKNETASTNLVNSLRCRDSFEQVLAGAAWTEEPTDLVHVALIASGRDLHGLAAKMWVGAFTEQPGLTEDPKEHWLDRAARSAVIAASGGGKDGGGLDATAAAELRTNALRWLADDIAFRSRLAKAGGAGANTFRWALERWKTDPKLASVRDPADLPKLLESEREAWANLWKDVDTRLAELSRGTTTRESGPSSR